MSLTSFQSRPAIDAAIYHADSTLYQLQPSFHPQLTEPEPTARARRAGEEISRAQREHRRDSAGPRAPRFACALLTLPGAAFDAGTGTGPPSTSTAAPCVQMNRVDGVEARRWRLGRLRSGLSRETAGRLGSRRLEKGTQETHQADDGGAGELRLRRRAA